MELTHVHLDAGYQKGPSSGYCHDQTLPKLLAWQSLEGSRLLNGSTVHRVWSQVVQLPPATSLAPVALIPTAAEHPCPTALQITVPGLEVAGPPLLQ